MGLAPVGGAYDLFMDLTERWGLGAWRTVLARRCRGRVLDLGCGTGRTLPLLERADVIVGVDPSLGHLRRARRRAPHVALVVGRAEALPFADDSFDTVVSALVFCSVASPQAGLQEVRRVLDPSGSLRMMEHVRSTKPWAAAVQDLAQPVWSAISGGCHPNRETERQVEAAGFRIQPTGRRARRAMRLFVARPRSQPCTSTAADPAGSDVA